MKHKALVDHYLEIQFDRKMDKMLEGREKNKGEAMEIFINALFCLKLYHSPRRWRTPEQARREFAALGSPTRQLEEAKQQLLMIKNGLEISAAHHPWKKDGHTFTGDELLEWIITTAMPLAQELERKRQLPTEPTVRMRSLPQVPKLGTTSDLPVGGITSEREEMDRFKAQCRAEFERRVETGEIDIYSEMQALIAPSRNKKLVGYEMEMWFGFPTNDWYRGKVISIINRKADTVKIAWDEKGLHEDDPRETIQELKETKYNPKTTKEGAWRRFFEK